MSRVAVVAGVLVVVIAGLLFLLAGHAHEKPTAQVEKPVSLANLT